jgi:hypothetical protein
MFVIYRMYLGLLNMSSLLHAKNAYAQRTLAVLQLTEQDKKKPHYQSPTFY